MWQDRLTAKFCDELKAADHADFIQSRTGLVIDAYFSGSKLRWMLDHMPGARESIGSFAFENERRRLDARDTRAVA